MKKLSIFCLIGLLAFFFQSCFFNEEDLFGESAANRRAKALEEYRSILTGAENGWKLEFYAGEEIDEGGVVLLMRFEGEQVTVMSDTEVMSFVTGEKFTPGDTTITSLFALIDDQGPVLTFNTYNIFIHNWSEPKGNADTDGYAGDYEFVIMSATNDKFVLKGKKRNVKMEMTRFDSNTEWKGYIDACCAMREVCEKWSTLVGYKDNEKFAPSLLTMSNILTITTSQNDKIVRNKISYVYTDKGIKLYQPTVINDVECYTFSWDEEKKIFFSDESTSVQLRYEQPEDYVPIEFYTENNWVFSFTTTNIGGTTDINVPVTFRKLEGDTLQMSPVVDYNIKFTYHNATGMIEMQTQYLGLFRYIAEQNVIRQGYLYLCPWETASGTAYLDEKAGLTSVTTQIEPRIFTFTDNGRLSHSEIDGFYYFLFSEPEMSNNTILGYVDTFSDITLSLQK